MFTRKISVLTDSPDAVAAYLYAHTTEQSRTPEGKSTRMVLVTTAETEDDAVYLANYQAARLCSGWHGATVLGEHE